MTPVFKTSAAIARAAILLLLVTLAASDATGSKNYSTDTIGGTGSISGKPAYPQIINLANRAKAKANATCGESSLGPEVYCMFAEPSLSQCRVCEAKIGDPSQTHQPEAAVDGNPGTWWQSPNIHYGDEFDYVTFTVDLRRVYQVSYIIMKFGLSPRPGNWILERSTDGGKTYRPWQYFAVSGEECVQKYGVEPVSHKEKVVQVYPNTTCVTSFSRAKPLENGEIHINLLKGHNSLNLLSPEVLDFSSAQHIQMRFQRLIYPNYNLDISDEYYQRRLFYAIKDIFIGGRVLCNGHAKKSIRESYFSSEPFCECLHNTCGLNCDVCCPLFNQRPWRSGPSICEKCQCHGHATECQYDPIIAEERSSLDIYGTFSGGGICMNCTKHTTGTNCEICEIGWYRPNDVKPEDPEPCLPCDCHPAGSDGNVCIPDKDTGVGLCNCIEGYGGAKCNECAPGYNGFPDCKPCSCDEKGVKTAPLSCENECICKVPIH